MSRDTSVNVGAPDGHPVPARSGVGLLTQPAATGRPASVSRGSMAQVRGRGVLRVRVLVGALALVGAGCSMSSPSGSPPARDAPTAAAPTPELVSAPLLVPSADVQPPFDQPRRVLIPAGWSMSVWARLPGARLAAWAPDGALLVSRPSAGEVVRLMPGVPGPTASVLLDGLTRPHGLAFDGGNLWVAQSDRLDSYPYRDGSTGPGRPLVTDLPDSRGLELGGAYAHALKSVTVGSDGAGYYSVGSTGNISAADRDAVPPRAVIMRVRPGEPASVFATGVRNGTGLAVAPDGAVWTAVNHRDNVPYPYDRPDGPGGPSARGRVLADYVADHPVEQIARLVPGRELGWPYCNPEADVDPGRAGSDRRAAGVPFVRDVDTNADGSRLDCARLVPTEQSLPAHSAPLGLSFAQLPAPYGTGALVGVHGSWNRNPPRAPEVSFLPWRNGSLGEQRTLVGGFQTADGSRWGRPVAAVRGPDGAVYITDDSAGAVYRLAPPAG